MNVKSHRPSNNRDDTILLDGTAPSLRANVRAGFT